MSHEELIAVHRQCLLDNIRAHRRAVRMVRNMPEIWAAMDAAFKEEVFIMREYLHNLEDRTGYPILSTTRAAYRREGRNVN